MNSNDDTVIITHVHMSRGPCTHVHVVYITAHIYEQWSTCSPVQTACALVTMSLARFHFTQAFSRSKHLVEPHVCNFLPLFLVMDCISIGNNHVSLCFSLSRASQHMKFYTPIEFARAHEKDFFPSIDRYQVHMIERKLVGYTDPLPWYRMTSET
jgi:hypothetical protein